MLRSFISAVLGTTLIWLGCLTADVLAQPRERYVDHGSFYSPPEIWRQQSIRRMPTGRFAVPGGSTTVYPYNPYGGIALYSDYPPSEECVLERRPVSTIHFLGWRTFLICPE
jgi:hypothetical protein